MLTGRTCRDRRPLPSWPRPEPWTACSPRSTPGEIELTGDGGFIPGLIKAALERGLQAELTSHLGYEKGDPDGGGVLQLSQRDDPKTVATQVGDLGLDSPRDREGTFAPQLVPKGSRRLSGLDEMIISLYAGGMTVRDIEHHLASTIGTELSPRDDQQHHRPDRR